MRTTPRSTSCVVLEDFEGAPPPRCGRRVSRSRLCREPSEDLVATAGEATTRSVDARAGVSFPR
jgi:hypothetical protein